MWLAEEFRPEHRSVLEWLNETGPKGTKFFAIRHLVVSIEGSEERRFEFEVVVEPNEMGTRGEYRVSFRLQLKR